jgi:hypothetical protein
MKRNHRFAGLLALTALGSIAATAAVAPDMMRFHERKEVAGLAVVFGAEPEPATTEEMQSLVWRVSSLAGEEPYADLKKAKVIVRFNGEEFGPYVVRGSRRNPGTYQSRHIFTADGEYESVLSFQKGDDPKVHSVDFTFRIGDRKDMEIPRRRGGGD